MPKKIAKKMSSRPRKSNIKGVVLAIFAVVVVLAFGSVMLLMNRSTDNRSQAAPGTKFAARIQATSAQSTGATSPNLAIDGNTGTNWNSAGSPRKWISLDLNETGLVKRVKLIVSQYPAGTTTHKVYVSTTAPTDTNLGQLVHTFTGSTSDNQTLEKVFTTPYSARYVTIETTASPSWVAWREIEVYRPDTTATPTPVPGQTTYSSTIQATATQAAGATNPSLAVDGNNNTNWNAAGSPTKWIALNLNQTGSVSRIRLVTLQSPAGATTHKVYVSATAPVQGSLGQLVHTFSGSTSDNQVLEKAFPTPLTNVRYVTIETTQSPSWVAWREIEVYRPNAGGGSSPTPTPTPTTGVPVRPGYTLIFNDEFDCPMTDNVASSCKTAFYNKWNTRYVYEGGTLDYLNPNTEVERYRDNGNHIVSNGTLKLIAKKVAEYDPNNRTKQLYESGMVRSKQTFSGNFYVEASVKIPDTGNQFSAVWMSARGGAWPPEFDIMESWDRVYSFADAKNPQNTNGRISIGPRPPFEPLGISGALYRPGINFAQAFHKYAYEINGTTYTAYHDDRQMAQWRFPMVDKDGQPAGPLDLIMNLAIVNNRSTSFPQTQVYEADYIRVYRKN